MKVDVRVVGATHRSLEALVASGEFRRDLYARLAGYSFALVPLRERKVDLGLLVASLLFGKVAAPTGTRIHREAALAMLRYDWPMNIRELEQCLRASTALAEGAVIALADLPAAVADALSDADSDERESPDADEGLKRELLVRMAEARGNVSEVARTMGKARQQVQRWVRRFGIDPEAFRTK